MALYQIDTSPDLFPMNLFNSFWYVLALTGKPLERQSSAWWSLTPSGVPSIDVWSVTLSPEEVGKPPHRRGANQSHFFLLFFLPLLFHFLFLLLLLFLPFNFRGRDRKTELWSSASLFKSQQHPWLCQAKARSWELNPNVPRGSRDPTLEPSPGASQRWH